jgi:hypothetical protein
MKYQLVLIFLLLLVGCDGTSSEYQEFEKKYHSNTRVFCDHEGFKIRETFLSKEAKAPQTYLINSSECRENKGLK